MATVTDFAELRRRAGVMEGAELMALAEAMDWRTSLARRRDVVYKKAGRKALVIPRQLERVAAKEIIAALEADAARGGK